MTGKEFRELLAAMESVRAEHCSTREKARRFLEQEGYLTETGELAEPYRPAD